MNFGCLLALGVVLLAGIAPLHADHYTYVSGVILDSSGASVPDALVSVINEDTGARRAAFSETDGGYVISSLLPGIYKVTVRKPGFRTMIRFGVKLNETQLAQVDFRLIIGSVQETVTVEGTAPVLDTEDGSVSTLVGRDEIDKLPLSGGGLLNVLELAPGLVVTPATRGDAGQFTVNGQRPNTHYFTVDGVSANSGVSAGGVPAQSNGGTLPGMTAFGSFDSLLSLDDVEQVRVQTSTTGPEFGRLPGAQISLNSKAGTNQYHGALLYEFRDQALDANNWFANQQGDPRATLHFNDFAPTFGGPIWRNHTFFFLSYEGMRLTQPFVLRQPVPSLNARQNAPAGDQALVSLFPLPNGPLFGNGIAQWTGSFSRPSRLDAGAVRFDQLLTSRATLFARYSDAPSYTEFGASPVNHLDLRSRSGTIGLDVRPRPNLVLELRVNASGTASNSVWQPVTPSSTAVCYVPGSCESLVRLSITGVGDVNAGPEGKRGQSQFQVGQTVSLNLGSHAISFGGDYRRLRPERRDASDAVSFIAQSLAGYIQNSNVLTAITPLQDTAGELEEASVFAEDTWRIAPRLTLTYGLRWEISPGPVPGVPANFLDPINGWTPITQPLWKTSYTNLAPRAGVAFRPFHGDRTVIRGGFGLYYDSSLSLATDLINDGPLNVSEYKGVNGIVSTRIEFGFLPNLRLPLVKQWNVSLQHAIDDKDSVSLGYVGSSSQDLIRREVGGQGSTQTTWFIAATNDGSSIYHALEAQFHRRLSRGLQVLVSYSWSHSIDNSSTDSGLYWAGSGLTPNLDRASSDFDIRQVVTGGITYEAPTRSRWIRGWALDGMFRARTGFPINVLDAEQYSGIGFENVFRPGLVSGRPIWIADGNAPGGRSLNPGAFAAGSNSVQGNLGRNAISGFGMSQVDLAIRREFFRDERRSLQLRIEAFNAFNHPNFADPVRFLSSPLFGQPPSMLNLMLGSGSPGSGLAPLFQAGGARSLQVAIRFRF